MGKSVKAALQHEFGNFDQIEINSVELPDPGEGDVRIRIESAGVNPVDAGILRGHLKNGMPHNFPIIPGWDMSGTVEERGFAARRFDVGDKVYAYVRRPFVQWGTFTEEVVIPESYLAARPGNIKPVEAGAIPLAGLTAYQSLYEAGNLSEGETVLILGASGGVGSMGIQLAKARDAQVIGIASSKNHSYMKELGADETIDYNRNNIAEEVGAAGPAGVDLIFDCTGGATLEQCLSTLKPDGKLVSIVNRGSGLDPEVEFQFVFVEPHTRQLDHLRELVESEKLNVHVGKTYSLEETASALKQIETLHTTGKIVIVPT